MKFEKNKRYYLKNLSLRDLIVLYFAHWTGYASNGLKTGISSNPTAARIDEYLFEHFPETWAEGHYEENGVHTKLMHKVLDICDKAYSPPSNAPIYVRKQMEKAWPEVEKFLNTTPLIDDNIQRESKMKNITFNQLKKFIKESKEQPKTWYGVPGTKWIWNGEWADPEVEYDGETINANELENYAWDQYKQECKEQGKVPSEEEFDDKLPVSWFKKQLDDFMFGRFGDFETDSDNNYDDLHAKEWMERHPNGYYNSEDDYGDVDESNDDFIDDTPLMTYSWSINELRDSGFDWESYRNAENSKHDFATPEEAYRDGLRNLQLFDTGDYELEVWDSDTNNLYEFAAEIHDGKLTEY